MKRFVIEPSKTIRQKVYEYLRNAILNGEYNAGDRLVEAEIGKKIGTSRTPVREALHNLERERLITSIPRVGYIVSEINEKELEELCEIRMVLEQLALRWAIERDYHRLLTDLKANIARAEQLVSNDDFRSFVEADTNFHEIVSQYAESSRLEELTQSIRYYMMRYRIQSIYSKENVVRAIEGHRTVVKAIEAGDIETAQKVLCAHIIQSRKDILLYALKVPEQNSLNTQN